MTETKRNFKAGFTLVELLVTISIFVILTGVVLFNQSKFNGSILLTNLAYDTALTIRQAQSYGINIKQFGGGDDGAFLPYGVHFDNGTKSFILFADTSYRDDSDLGLGIFTGSINICNLDEGCVSRYNITKGNFVSDLCADGICGLTSLDIVFRRPNPDAVMVSDPVKSSITSAQIVLSSPTGSLRTVEVQSNGLIQIDQ